MVRWDMSLIMYALIAVASLLLLIPSRRRGSEPFDWTKRHSWWSRWRARSAFPNSR